MFSYQTTVKSVFQSPLEEVWLSCVSGSTYILYTHKGLAVAVTVLFKNIYFLFLPIWNGWHYFCWPVLPGKKINFSACVPPPPFLPIFHRSDRILFGFVRCEYVGYEFLKELDLETAIHFIATNQVSNEKPTHRHSNEFQ